MARLNLEHLKRSIPSKLIYSVFRLIGDDYNHKLLNQYLDTAPWERKNIVQFLCVCDSIVSYDFMRNKLVRLHIMDGKMSCSKALLAIIVSTDDWVVIGKCFVTLETATSRSCPCKMKPSSLRYGISFFTYTITY